MDPEARVDVIEGYSCLDYEPTLPPFDKRHGSDSLEPPTTCLGTVWFRLLVLAVICSLTFGSYFVYDTPGAIPNSFDNVIDNTYTSLKGCKTTSCATERKSHFALLYSLYSFPNMILSFFGGLLLDRVGIRFGALLFCFFIVAGQAVVSLGAQIDSFVVILIGRFIFGLGGENMSVAQSSFTARWFRGKEMAFAFGIQLSISRIGSSVNYMIEPTVTEHSNLAWALWLGTLLCVVSMVGCIVLAVIDKRAEKSNVVKSVSSDEVISWRDVGRFPFALYLIFGICIFFYISVFVFLSLYASQYLQHKWGLSQARAGVLVAIPYTVSAVASPFLGFAIDKLGRSLIFMASASALLSGTYLFLYYQPVSISPLPAMLSMGICYSVCAAAIWPCVALVVDMKVIGTAYGLMTALQNAGLAAAPLAFPLIRHAGGYKWVMFAFAISAALSFAGTLLLLVLDMTKGGGRLNATPEQRDRLNAIEDEKLSLVADRQPSADDSVTKTFTASGKIVPVTPSKRIQRTEEDLRRLYYYKIGVAARFQ